ncbi:serine/threonine-protein kinase [Actinomadura sp. DC4]|uniref:serine/threonine-protein kinase n=1 Tax=Actinomadura sp. DC4 TaxID=3055069 RepID=UPI0025AF4676|nr:serine/threonine-protein kinase [Actinomadura sp. DC4]MDN3358071.1 protein kinase [Actinomadura sp. DC4]
MTRLLAGRYRLAEPLGRGGMGTVWRAHDEALGRTVAVKELSLPRGVAPDHRARLCERAIREARVSSRLRHASIIRVHDVIAEDDRPWIVMELLAGRALDEAGPLPPARAAAIGLTVLEALGAAHAQGVLHRDVKPGNVFLCDDGRVVLADFGIASLAGDVSLTVAGGLVGSPGYIAPERLRDEPAGPPSDLWSLGATLYTAVEGRSPFERRTVAGVLGAVLTEEPRPPERAGPLAPVLLALLEKNPARRPPPEAARTLLRSVASGGTPAIPDTVPATRAPRHGARWAAAAVAAAVAVALVVFLPDGKKPTGSQAPADPVRGRFTAAPQPCSLLTPAEATRLGARSAARPEAQGCSWGGGTVEVWLQHFAPRGSLSAPSLAEEYFADKKRQLTVSAHSADTIDSTQSGVADVPSVADAAFAYDATDGVDAGRSSTVWLRSSNLVLKVVRADHTGATDAAALRGGAVEAARTVAAHL